jgi:hypothetical protein
MAARINSRSRSGLDGWRGLPGVMWAATAGQPPARVSTREQDLTGQVAELQAAGCAKIFSEKASGARGDRAELARVIKRLQPGDVLVVTRLDRLARSTRDLLNVLEAVKQAGAGFRSLIPAATSRLARRATGPARAAPSRPPFCRSKVAITSSCS